MNYPVFTVEEVMKTLQRLKSRKASGPDKSKPEVYKALKDSQACLRALTNCFQNILDEEQKVKEWEKSITKMIPKTNRPTAGQLRPIALTDITYKLFMTLNGQRIDQHVILNDQNKETQTGFTRGCQTEDNLLILQYCIDNSYNYSLPLIITSVDYSKAFDSVKRESIVKALMHYKIYPK